MGLQAKICAEQSSDCTQFSVFEETGLYNAITNPAGYNAPNPTLASANAATLDVLFPDAIVPISFNVFPTLPNVVNTPFIVTSAMLGLGATLPDGIYEFTYTVSGANPPTYPLWGAIAKFTILVTCKTKCCIDKKLAAISDEECNCGCKKTENALFAYTILRAAQESACCGRIENAKKLMKLLTKLCDPNGCKGC